LHLSLTFVLFLSLLFLSILFYIFAIIENVKENVENKRRPFKDSGGIEENGINYNSEETKSSFYCSASPLT